MISGEGYEVFTADRNGERRWLPVEFFATSLTQDGHGRVGLGLIIFAIVGDELVGVSGKIRRSDRIAPTERPR